MIGQKARVNEHIRVPEVRVIDAEGKPIGIMPTSQALEMAKAEGLDLIEVSPKAKPPVVKILSFDKYRYHLEKSLQQQRKKQKKIDVKGIRISVRIGQHDLEFKAGQADKFLGRGDKVKVELRLRGRERGNMDYALEVIQKFLLAVKVPYQVEQEPKRLGSVITAVIGAKAQ